MVDFKELENFRRQWKNELKPEIRKADNDERSVIDISDKPISEPCPESFDDRRQLNETSVFDKNNKQSNVARREKATSPRPHRSSKSPPRKDAKKDEEGNKFKPFLIAEKLLEGVSGRDSVQTTKCCEEQARDAFIQDRNKRLKLASATPQATGQEKSDSYLDIFLADLQEINEIPFFETSLPRELAIKIFMYLDPQDLCRCCQVSKPWKNLAEDELLWNQICNRLGYEDSTATVEKSRWKEIVKDHVLKERQLRLNWKMRHAEVTSLDYVTGGILCAASSCNHRLIAGYSYGHVKVWDEDDDYVFRPSNTALAINESAECGTVANMVDRVCVNHQIAAASYSQGNVDVWKVNSKQKAPVNTVTLEKHITSLSCSKTEPLLIFSAADSIWTYKYENSHSNTNFVEIAVGYHVSHLQIVPRKPHLSSQQLLAIGLFDQVRIHHLGDDPANMRTMHNTIGQRVTVIDCDSVQTAVGIHADDGSIVKLYDLHKCTEVSALLGSALPVCALNLADSPPNSLVSGSLDGKVRVYDTRLTDPVISLRGHASLVNCVQMDDWKVVSGGSDGMVIVWDQRMASKLWEQHNRHPVKYMAFKENVMYAANIPVEKVPESDGFESIYHRRHRGSLCFYNFSVDLIRHPDLPINVLSTYDDPEGYNYNISLAVPYD